MLPCVSMYVRGRFSSSITRHRCSAILLHGNTSKELQFWIILDLTLGVLTAIQLCCIDWTCFVLPEGLTAACKLSQLSVPTLPNACNMPLVP